MKQTEGIFFFFFAVPYLFVNFFSLVSFVLEHFPYSELGKLHSCSKSSFLLLNLSLLYKVVRSGRMIQVLLLFCLLHTVFLILQEYFIDELYVLPSFSLNYIISRYFITLNQPTIFLIKYLALFMVYPKQYSESQPCTVESSREINNNA